MIVNKPTVLLYTIAANPRRLRDVCAGIEEEGVLYEVKEQESGDLETLAYLAANNSMLGSGIGIVGDAMALQIKGMPMGSDVFVLRHPTAEQCRHLGANSARAIKKMPFKEDA